MMNSSHSDMPSPSPGHDQEGVGGRGGDGSDKANHRPSHPNPNPYPYPYHHPMKKQNRLCEGLGNGGASLCRSSSSPSSSVGPTPHSDENNNNNNNTNTNNNNNTNTNTNNAVPSSSYKEHDAAYFHSYAHVGVHEEMIKDRVRTEAYRDAIFQHSDMIRNKVVVDVGCGTGILSIFCAYAGARKVYAIDASDIAVQAREVVKANKLSDTITVLLGRVEEVEIDEEVDVIVSEWMGYMLLYESMLASVICARDRWLKPGGIMLPSFATLYFAPITNSERYAESIDFWCNIYGIDMSAMIPLAKQCSFEEPCIEMISPENILSWPFVVKHFDCSTVTVQEIENVKVDFRLQSIITAPLHGFAFWFEVTFGNPSTSTNDTHSESSIDSTLSGNFQSNNAQPQSIDQIKAMNPIVLSTAPEEVPTHWQQTVIYTYEPVAMRQDQVIEGSLSLSQSKENPRFLNILLDYTCGGRYFVKESVMR